MVDITATDNGGDDISKLGKPLSISLPVKNQSKKKAHKSCLGYRKSKKDRWRCDHESSSNNKVGLSRVVSIDCLLKTYQSRQNDDLSWEGDEFDHLTSFAVLFEVGGGTNCSARRKYWISSLVLLG